MALFKKSSSSSGSKSSEKSSSKSKSKEKSSGSSSKKDRPSSSSVASRSGSSARPATNASIADRRGNIRDGSSNDLISTRAPRTATSALNNSAIPQMMGEQDEQRRVSAAGAMGNNANNFSTAMPDAVIHEAPPNQGGPMMWNNNNDYLQNQENERVYNGVPSATENSYGEAGQEANNGSFYNQEMGGAGAISAYGNTGGVGTPMNSAYGSRMAMDSMYGSSAGMRRPMDSAYGPQMGEGGAYGPTSGPGSMYAPPPGPGSMYAPPPGPGSMYAPPPGPGSMFGTQMGMGSMYGPPPGMGSMYGPPPGMGSMYGPPPGPGSMFGTQMGMGSMYGPPPGMGSMCGSMGSLYGCLLNAPSMFGPPPGMGSMYGPQQGMASMYGSQSGMGSIYKNGAPSSTMIDLSRPDEDKPKKTDQASQKETELPRNSSGTNFNVPSSNTNAKPEVAKVVTKTTQRAQPMKSVSFDGIRTMVVVSDAAGSKITVKETEKKVSLKDADGKAAEYEADEVLRASKATVENSALLREPVRQVESSHSTALILANGKNQQSVSQDVALSTIKAIMASLKKGEVEKGTKYEVYMTAASMPTPSTAKDLFADSVAAPKPVRIGSNPIFGACLMDLKEKMPRNESDAESHLRDALKKSTDPKEPVLVHLVVKQIKKSTGTGADVSLSSVQFVFAKEQGDYLRAMHDKDEKVVPLPLFKDVVGGSCCAVVVAAVSGDDAAGETTILRNAEKLRKVKNSPPRSGNLTRFMEFTKEHEKKCEAAAASATDSAEKARHERTLQKMRIMLADGKELMAKPEGTKPKVYASSSSTGSKASRSA